MTLQQLSSLPRPIRRYSWVRKNLKRRLYDSGSTAPALPIRRRQCTQTTSPQEISFWYCCTVVPYVVETTGPHGFPSTPHPIFPNVHRLNIVLSSCRVMCTRKGTCNRLISTDRDSAADLSFAPCALSRRFIAAANAPTRSVQSRSSACKFALLRLAAFL